MTLREGRTPGTHFLVDSYLCSYCLTESNKFSTVAHVQEWIFRKLATSQTTGVPVVPNVLITYASP